MFHPSFRGGTRLAAIAQVEHETRVARCEPPELGRGHLVTAEELFDLADQHGEAPNWRIDPLRLSGEILLV
jgi:hypothetical protein